MPATTYPTPAAWPGRALLGGDRLLAKYGIGPLNWRADLPDVVRELEHVAEAA